MKDALMEYETIDSEQVADLMARRKVRPPRSCGEGGFKGDSDDDAAATKAKDDQTAPIVGGPAEES